MMKIRSLLISLTLLAPTPIMAASGHASPSEARLHRPLEINLLLSGNFGELRNNHFHSGLDFKTGGRTGHKVYCAADGYVSRVLVSPWGFGRAVYVTHPALGLTTVYGHLLSFSDKIDKPVRKRQYDAETFRVDMEFKPGQIPVRRGEVIALSGNSGSSGGPHLHMDVRDAATEEPLDPMPYFKDLIVDRSAPEVRSITLYPRQGLVDGESSPASRTPATASRAFKAWGQVVPGIKAYDRMTGTANIYGVKYLTLTVDGKQVYRRATDRFSFDNTRALNTIIDYPSRIKSNSWTMTTSVPASRPLGSMIEAVDNGVLTINESREYKCRFTLEDEHGNITTQDFTIIGERQPVPKIMPQGEKIEWNKPHLMRKDGAELSFPTGCFYEDTHITLSSIPTSAYKSNLYMVGDTDIPLAKSFEISLPVTVEPFYDKRQYRIIRIDGKKRTSIGGSCSDSKITATTNRFGKYAVVVDTKAPTITPLSPLKWAAKNMIRVKIADDLSGIADYRGEIDGKWILMEFDGKTGTLTGHIDRKQFPLGSSHNFILTVTDACGNKSEFSHRL